MLSRRAFVRLGGGLFFAAGFSRAGAAAAEAFEIVMRGNADGSKVWFDPVGLLVRPGASVTWVNRDPGNAHTSTAYHPDNDGRPLRIPAGAGAWNSDYLLPDQSFTATFSEPGIYDYFCIPHEMAGMVGRIVVLDEGAGALPAQSVEPLADHGEDAFPAVETILRDGRVAGGEGGGH